jgi:transposase
MEGVKEKIKEYEVSERGIKEFRKELNKETEVAVEATGNSGYFYDEIREYVKEVILINALEFKAISSSTKKTDKNDARVICRHLVANMLPRARYLREEERELRSIINLRDNYVKDKNAYKTRIDNILSAIGEEEIGGDKESERYEEKIEGLKISVVRKMEIRSLVKQIQGLKEEIKKLSEEINKMGKKKRYHKSLKSITGIGDLSATIIGNAIVDIDDFDDEKKLCAYAGLIPSVRDSGGKQRRGKITKKGNKLLRTILVQAATTATRYGVLS